MSEEQIHSQRPISIRTKWGTIEGEQETVVDVPAAKAKDPLGLYTVYEPPKECDAVLDVIFVHALEGGSHSTWTPDGYSDSFDLLNSLTQEELPVWFPRDRWPGSVRLMTYGYVGFKAGQQGLQILELGVQLLESLYRHLEQSEEEDRGLMLVCSGLGGWVAKAALCGPSVGVGMSDYQWYRRKLRSRLASVIFRNTPSRPLDPAEDVADVLWSHVWLTVSDALEEEFRKSRDTIALLNQSFKQCEPTFQIYSLIPTWDSGPSLVRQYATVGLPNEAVLGICPENPVGVPYQWHHEYFKAISRCVFNTAWRCIQNQEERRKKVDEAKAQGLRNAKRVLAQASPHWTADRIEALSASRSPGTFQWLLEEDDFCLWRDGKFGRRILWMTGDAGWGKTYLASFVVDQLREQGHAVHAYLFPFDDERLVTPEDCLLSLAFQQASRSHVLRQGLTKEDYRDGKSPSIIKLRNLDAEALWARLQAAGILHDTADRLYIVIDCLDECTDPNTLLDILVLWSKSHQVPLRILILSRHIDLEPMPGIEMLLMQARNVRYDVGAILNNYTRVLSDSSAKKIAALIRKLTQHSLLRTPLWASLAIQKLDGCHSDVDFNHTLQSLPESAEIFFDEAVSAVNLAEHQQLSLFLAWVGVLSYPLKLQGLLQLLVASPLVSPKLRLEEQAMFPKYDGLLFIDPKAQIRFVHKMARDAVFISSSRKQESRLRLDSLLLSELADNYEPHKQLWLASMTVSSKYLRMLHMVPTQPQESGDHRLYALTQFPKHLALFGNFRLSHAEHLRAVLEMNFVGWVEWLTRLDETGERVLHPALGHLRAVYAYLSTFHPAVVAPLRFLRTIVNHPAESQVEFESTTASKPESSVRSDREDRRNSDQLKDRRADKGNATQATSLLTPMQGRPKTPVRHAKGYARSPKPRRSSAPTGDKEDQQRNA